jgi:hypothetical protein
MAVALMALAASAAVGRLAHGASGMDATQLSNAEPASPSGNAYQGQDAEGLLDAAQYDSSPESLAASHFPATVGVEAPVGAPSGGAFIESSDGYLSGDCYAAGGSVPVNWISGPYLKAGTSVSLNDAILEQDQVPGYTISGGYRQPLGPAASSNLFFDVGGDYLSAFGKTSRFVASRQINPFTSDVVITPNNFFSTLKEVQRGSAHAALGWYWGSPVDDPSQDPQFRLATRLGARAGHIRGKFDDVPRAGLVGATPFYDDTDVFGGVLAGVEGIWLLQRSRYCDVKWTLDAEFSNDWINFSSFDSGSMTTASVTLGFMLSR